MKIRKLEPPREFEAGKVRIRHTADITLEPGEQVTFVTPGGHEYDVVRKEWGYYASPSLNGRLQRMGFRSALVCNPEGKIFLRLVEKEREETFSLYLAEQGETLLCWLDSDEDVLALLRALGVPPPPGLAGAAGREEGHR
jgi:hypothetical protein